MLVDFIHHNQASAFCVKCNVPNREKDCFNFGDVLVQNQKALHNEDINRMWSPFRVYEHSNLDVLMHHKVKQLDFDEVLYVVEYSAVLKKFNITTVTAMLTTNMMDLTAGRLLTYAPLEVFQSKEDAELWLLPMKDKYER